MAEKLNVCSTEWFQFIVSLVIIVPFIAYIGIFHWFQMTQEAKDVLAMLGAFVGTIVGFYFGQRPVQNLTQQVATATNKNQSFTVSSFEAEEIIESDKVTIEELRGQIKSLKQTIESLNNDNEE